MKEWVVLAPHLLFLAGLHLISRHGFEFTDEGYYLNSVNSPQVDSGFWSRVAWPLWKMANQNVARYRFLNLALIYLVSALVGFLMARSHWTRLRLHLHAGLFGLLGLSIFRVWLPEPNYNSLTYLGLLAGCIGLLLPEKGSNLVLSLSLGIVILSKPSSGFLLSLTLAVMYLASRRIKGLVLLVSLTIAVCLSLSQFGGWQSLGEIVSGFEQLRNDAALGGSSLSSAFRTDLRTWVEAISMDWVYWLVCVFALFTHLVIAVRSSKGRAFWISLLTLVSVFSLGVLYQPVAILPVFWLSTLLVVALLGPLVARATASFHTTIRGLFILFFPFIFAFGTNTDYGFKYVQVPLFFLLATWILYGRRGELLSVLSFLALLVGVASLATSINSPYRQPTGSLLSQSSQMEDSPIRSLLISETASRFITSIADEMEASGFKNGDGILDLTGRNPGLIFALGARPIATAWLGADWLNGERILERKLAGLTCRDLTLTWVLHEPGGYASFDLKILDSVRDEHDWSLKQIGRVAAYPVNGVVPVNTTTDIYRFISNSCPN